MDEQLDQYITELRHTVTTASMNFDIWWIYKEKETRVAFTKTMNRYSAFFQTSLHAHFVALIIALYRLYETRNDTFNVPTLLRMLRDEKSLSPALEKQLIEQYACAKVLWIKVGVLRNNAFGHRSKAHTVPEIFAEAEITPDELRELMELTRKILNLITNELQGITHIFNLDARGDTIKLLEDITKHHDRSA